MFKRVGRLAVLFTVLALAGVSIAREERDAAGAYFERTTQKPYAAVLTDAEYAAGDHNFRITGRNTIGAAIAERHATDFPQYTVLQFCNLELARRLLQADPNLVRYMPCHLYIYERAGEVVVGAPLFPGRLPAAREANEIVRAIVDYAAE